MQPISDVVQDVLVEAAQMVAVLIQVVAVAGEVAVAAEYGKCTCVTKTVLYRSCMGSTQ